MSSNLYEFKNGAPAKCAHCGQPFRIGDHQVECWRSSDGSFFCNEFCADDAEEANSLYNKLENMVIPLYLESPVKWARLMRTTLAFNGSYFNTNRMVKQYTRNAYYPVRMVGPAKVQEEVFAD